MRDIKKGKKQRLQELEDAKAAPAPGTYEREAADFYNDLQNPVFAQQGEAMVSDTFIEAARRKVDEIVDQGGDLRMQEQKYGALNHIFVGGDEKSVKEFGDFIRRLHCH